MNVLVIEDEINIAKPLCRMLEKNNITAESVQDGLSGYLQGRRSTYDVIVLDIMLPEMDGLTVLKKLREEGVFTPILLLTAKDSTEDKVRGLELGADDRPGHHGLGPDLQNSGYIKNWSGPCGPLIIYGLIR